MRYQIVLALAIVPLCALAWWLIQSTPYLSYSGSFYSANLDHSKQNAIFCEGWHTFAQEGLQVNLESGQSKSLSSTEVLTAFSKRIDNWLLVDFVADSSFIVLPPHSYHLHNLAVDAVVPIALKLDWRPNLVHGGFLVGENENPPGFRCCSVARQSLAYTLSIDRLHCDVISIDEQARLRSAAVPEFSRLIDVTVSAGCWVSFLNPTYDNLAEMSSMIAHPFRGPMKTNNILRIR